MSCGFASERGGRPDNQDFGGWREEGGRLVAAVADGVGGREGGRVAAETTVRGFLDAWGGLPATLGMQRAGSRALEALNDWVHAQGRVDPKLAGMACAFSALALRGRVGHVLHVGDTRVYRLDGRGCEQLTQDHVYGRGEMAHALLRAVGFEPSIKIEHLALGLKQHDRFLICSDGVHGELSVAALTRRMAERLAPRETAEALVRDALAAGGADNATALVIDIVDLPAVDADELSELAAALPILPLPKAGDVVDGFRLEGAISQGRYSLLFRAVPEAGGPAVALKFPHPRVASEAGSQLAFVREAWVAARTRSPFVGEVIELPPERRSRLYTVMPFYAGETLEQKLTRENIRLREGVAIAGRMARALDALHRVGVTHRDVKPENVILTEDGGLRLIDLGVAHAEGFADFSESEAPGTPSYKAPELFAGGRGDGLSDLFALGVTVYRMFGRDYPYGEAEAFARPRFEAYRSLSRLRPDLPGWLDAVIAKAVAVKPGQRYGDVLEFAQELEAGLRLAAPGVKQKPPLIERNPEAFWKGMAAVLAAALALLLARWGWRGP